VRVEALEVAALVALALCYAAGVVMAWASATRLVALYLTGLLGPPCVACGLLAWREWRA
jgi:hypothetical protein